MTDLTNLLKASIQQEGMRQAIKTYNGLARQMLETLKPSATCSPVVADAMRQEAELWQCALEAGEKALLPVAANEAGPIPMLKCTACGDPTPGLIDGFCLECDELFNLSMQCGFQPKGVLQMPKRRVQ